ncbi:helix-turn-helix domain-containing protein [Novispirillum sp. DQ9]|uniref:helix-turn-helix domain-containing protein n=1 Tax=Novispirillum sp. DQ9 TaxID=3398612 RepID=UPI003C7E356F
MKGATQRRIPLYALYGEEGAVEAAEFVHIEDLASRSSLYNWEIRPHTHAALFQVLTVSAGTVTTALDGRMVSVAGPAVITVPVGTVHGFQMTPGTTGMVLSIAISFLGGRRDVPGADVLREVLSTPAALDFSASPEAFAEVEDTLRAVMDEFRTPQIGRAMMFDALLRRLAVLLRRKMAPPVDSDSRQSHRRSLFTRLRDLVEQHYRDRWKVGDYAAALALSESALNRLCEDLAGKTAFEVLQDRILLEAQRYLIYTEVPVAQIAYDLGFSDPAYFCRYFRQRTGENPRAFRGARTG